MEKYDLKQYKFVIAVLIICTLFGLAIIRAYYYLPHDSINKISTSGIELPKEDSQNDETTDKEDDVDDEVDDTATTEEDDVEITDETENVQEEIKPVAEQTEKQEDKAIIEAKNYVVQKDYENAIQKYKDIISNSENEEIKAQCYLNLAKIYAFQRRYGSAMVNAQKSYSIKPSTEAEMIIAKLYYKSGEIERATQRINSMLKKDFKLED